MKITRTQLRAIIKEVLAHIVLDDIHEVPDDLEFLDPHEAYGLGHEAGMEHANPEDRPYDPVPESHAEDDEPARTQESREAISDLYQYK